MPFSYLIIGGRHKRTLGWCRKRPQTFPRKLPGHPQKVARTCPKARGPNLCVSLGILTPVDDSQRLHLKKLLAFVCICSLFFVLLAPKRLSSSASRGALHGGKFKVEKAHFAARQKSPENRKNELKLRPPLCRPLKHSMRLPNLFWKRLWVLQFDCWC